MKRLRKQYKLVSIRGLNAMTGDTKQLQLQTEELYGDTFETEEEALAYAVDANDWLYKNFCVLPIYDIVQW